MINNSKELLLASILEGIKRKKGQEIININLSEIQNSFCQNFIICHAESNTQVNAIAESVQETVFEEQNQKAWHREGLDNCQWVLLDYADIVVHIFQKEYRNFYKLEDLWADANIDKIESEY